MIYIWEENEEFYSSLPNKSDFINNMLALARKEQENKRDVQVGEHPDPRMREIQRQVKAMEDRDRQNRA